MSTSLGVMDFVSTTLSAVKAVIPLEIKHTTDPIIVENRSMVSRLGVVIDVTGAFAVCLILDAHETTFANIAQLMYGMPLEGEMLESFVGEIGNMVAGSAASELAAKGLDVSISTPTVLSKARLQVGEGGVHVPLQLSTLGDIKLFLIPELNTEPR